MHQLHIPKVFFRQHGKPGEAKAEPTEFRVHHAGKARTKQLGRGNIPKIRAQKSREFHGMKQRESPAGAHGSGRDRAEFLREGRELRGWEFHAWEGPRPGWSTLGLGNVPAHGSAWTGMGLGWPNIPGFRSSSPSNVGNIPTLPGNIPNLPRNIPTFPGNIPTLPRGPHPPGGIRPRDPDSVSRIPRLRLGMDHPWSRRCGIAGKGGEFQQDSGFLSWD